MATQKVTQKIFKVVVNGPFWEPFEYLPLDEVAGVDLRKHIGCRAWVPLGHRKTVGIIIDVSESVYQELDKLKVIDAFIDHEPQISSSELRFYKWLGTYYHCYPFLAFKLGLPNFFLAGETFKIKQKEFVCPLPLSFDIKEEELPKRASKLKKLVVLLKQYPDGLPVDQLKYHNITRATVNRGQDKGWLEINASTSMPAIYAEHTFDPIKLSEAQQKAVELVCAKLEEFAVTLCYGVTGSGKTEVYLRVIQQVLRCGQQALILVPEISLTPQTVLRFQKRLDVPVVCSHSKMTDTERYQTWKWLADGDAQVLIATRSGVFSSFKNLGVIIIDEEHDTSFKQQSGVRYHARDVAIMRAKFENIPILLGSATPSLETLEQTNSGQYQRVELQERAGDAQPCKHYVIDMRLGKAVAGLSNQLIERTRYHIGNGNQVLIFINRRGYAPTLMCHSCGWVAECERCESPYTLHQNPQQLCCHHCGRINRLAYNCPKCQASDVMPVGVGTEQVESFFNEHFPDIRTLRIDRDRISKKGELETALSEIQNHQVDVIIGTQMIAKGHHFPKLTMVGILNIDASLFSGDFRAIEKMGQLVEQVAGRAGRELEPGEVYLQTSHPEHYLLTCLLRDGYESFSKHVLEERKQAHWPPFSYLATVRAEAHNHLDAAEFLNALKTYLLPIANNQSVIYGALPALKPKKAGMYRQILILKSTSRSELHKLLASVQYKLQVSKKSKVKWVIDVDPQEML